MALPPLVIRLKTDGTAEVVSGLGNVQRGIKIVGEASKQTAEDVGAIDDAIRKVKGDAFLKAAQDANHFEESLKTAREAMDGLNARAERMRNAGLAIGAVGTAGVVVANAMAKAGSDAVETENLISESFEGQADAVKTWGDELQNQLGISSLEVRRAAGTFNLMFGSMGIGQQEALKLSKDLSMLAQDMASFYNLAPEEAFDKLRAGITGEAEPLKALGILIDETTVKNYAYANGIAATGAELTNNQKVMARYGIIMASTAKAQGDLARTADSASNTARRASVAYEQAMQRFGIGAAEAKKSIDNVTTGVLTFASANEGIAAKIGWLFTMGSYATSGVGGLIALAGQIAQTITAYNTMRIARTLDTAAAVRNTAAVTVNSSAQVASGRAATLGAVGFGHLALAENTSALASTRQAGAVALAGTASSIAGGRAAIGAAGYEYLAIAETSSAAASMQQAGAVTIAGNASAAAGARAAVGAAGFGLLALKILAVIALAAAAIYAIDRLWNKKEDDALAANIEKGKEKEDEILFKVNEKRVEKGLPALTREQFAGDEKYPERDPVTGPSILHAQKMAAQAAAQSAAATAATSGAPIPATGGGISLPSLSASAGSRAAVTTGSLDGVMVGERDPYADRIRDLRRQKRDLKGKENEAARQALQAQIDQLGDSQRQWKEQQAEAKKSDDAADRRAKLLAEVEALKQDSEFELKIAQLRANQEIANKAQKRAIDRQIAELEIARAYANAQAEIRGMDKDDPFAIHIARQKADIQRDAARRQLDIKAQAGPMLLPSGLPFSVPQVQVQVPAQVTESVVYPGGGNNRVQVPAPRQRQDRNDEVILEFQPIPVRMEGAAGVRRVRGRF